MVYFLSRSKLLVMRLPTAEWISNTHSCAWHNGYLGNIFKYILSHSFRAPFGLGEGINRFLQIIAKTSDFIADKSYHEIAGSVQSLEERLQDITDLHAMNRLNGGHLLYFKTIYYLYDRDHFEYG